MTYVSVKWVDIVFLIFGIAAIILVIIVPPPNRLDYVPDAVKGLTTLTSILVGFIGFSMTHIISITEDKKIKK